MKINKEHIGKKFIASVKGGNGKVDIVEGAIGLTDEGNILILSSYPPWAGNTNYGPEKAYMYSIRICSLGRNVLEYLSGIISFKIVEDELLVKKDATGFLFRKIYETNKTLIYLGAIRKDPEQAKLPSAMVTIHDKEYIISKGWETYKEEPSAEERVNSEIKKKVPH